jgi:hypothetical protein
LEEKNDRLKDGLLEKIQSRVSNAMEEMSATKNLFIYITERELTALEDLLSK